MASLQWDISVVLLTYISSSRHYTQALLNFIAIKEQHQRPFQQDYYFLVIIPKIPFKISDCSYLEFTIISDYRGNLKYYLRSFLVQYHSILQQESILQGFHLRKQVNLELLCQILWVVVSEKFPFPTYYWNLLNCNFCFDLFECQTKSESYLPIPDFSIVFLK